MTRLGIGSRPPRAAPFGGIFWIGHSSFCQFGLPPQMFGNTGLSDSKIVFAGAL
jgi:hypothetical protein